MPFRIDIIESERGWGQKLDRVLYFETEAEAWEYEKEYNSKNPPGPAPDWYMQAEDPRYISHLPPGEKYYKKPIRYINDN